MTFGAKPEQQMISNLCDESAGGCRATLLKSDIGLLPICDCKPTHLLFLPHLLCLALHLFCQLRKKSGSPCSGWMEPDWIPAPELQTRHSQGYMKIMITIYIRMFRNLNFSFRNYYWQNPPIISHKVSLKGSKGNF